LSAGKAIQVGHFIVDEGERLPKERLTFHVANERLAALVAFELSRGRFPSCIELTGANLLEKGIGDAPTNCRVGWRLAAATADQGDR